jgi:hypothetical protein
VSGKNGRFEIHIKLKKKNHFGRKNQSFSLNLIELRYTLGLFNPLKPTGHVMHQQFNIQQLYFCPHCIYVFCIYLRTNSDLCHLQHKLIGFYNRDEKCLLSGMNWVFK